MLIQHNLADRPFCAFHTHYFIIPIFHYSIWPKELDGCKKNNNSSKLLQDPKLITVNTPGNFFQEVFDLSQLLG